MTLEQFEVFITQHCLEALRVVRLPLWRGSDWYVIARRGGGSVLGHGLTFLAAVEDFVSRLTQETPLAMNNSGENKT